MQLESLDLGPLRPYSAAGGLSRFRNCLILRSHKLLSEELWIEDGKLRNPEPIFFEERRKPDRTIDCQGALLAPGFIDIQINGGFGMDFSSAETPDRLQMYVDEMSKRLLQYGVTSFCPTIVSSDDTVYRKTTRQLKRRPGAKESAGVLGLHLEGPFISSSKKGAHKESHVLDSPGSLEDMLAVYGNSFDNVSIVTLAPEVPFSSELTKHLTSLGVRVSMGHSEASLAQAETLFTAGATCLTHVFNAMGPFHHKDPGLVGMLASSEVRRDRMVYFGIISDGVHTEDAALRIAHKTHPDGLILISDANAGLGLSDGVHVLGDAEVEISDRHAYIKGTKTLAGSVSPINKNVQHLMKAARCSAVEALECASLHPAQFLGIEDRKGSLDFDSDADFVLLHPETLDVIATFVGGQLAYWKGNAADAQ